MTDAEMPRQTMKQVVREHPQSIRKTLSDDLLAVAKWLKCKPQNLMLRKAEVPAESFRSLVDNLVETYANFPGEKIRTQKILKKIGKGEPLLPVFIEENDPESFIMEGRHRIVAFLLAGASTVPVLYASALKRPLDPDAPSP
jgi:hypothetical protein